MSLIIQGTYKDGAVLLDNRPEGVQEARVAVIFVEQPNGERRRGILKFGMFAKPDRPFTTDADIDAVIKSWNGRPTE